ncbi:MAG: two-component system cell cycle response regulator [bacterium]|jgi:two-component system cell cycle response regulator
MPDISILAVDDDTINLDLIKAYFSDINYNIITASGGKEALSILSQSSHKIHTILLDWMMPEMDGIEVLKKIKENPLTAHIPVIMQTARAKNEDVIEGISHGVFYYLTKPFEEKLLLSIVHASVNEHQRFRHLMEEVEVGKNICGLMESGFFRFRTLIEAENLAHWLANVSPNPKNTLLGLIELFFNAIEHGNLGISYDEKSVLMEKNMWWKEVTARLEQDKYQDLFVEVQLKKTEKAILFYIKDQGDGFDFKQFLSLNESRLFDNHGKGILMAKMLYFDELHYSPSGNSVEAVTYLNQK